MRHGIYLYHLLLGKNAPIQTPDRKCVSVIRFTCVKFSPSVAQIIVPRSKASVCAVSID